MVLVNRTQPATKSDTRVCHIRPSGPRGAYLRQVRRYVDSQLVPIPWGRYFRCKGAGGRSLNSTRVVEHCTSPATPLLVDDRCDEHQLVAALDLQHDLTVRLEPVQQHAQPVQAPNAE